MRIVGLAGFDGWTGGLQATLPPLQVNIGDQPYDLNRSPETSPLAIAPHEDHSVSRGRRVLSFPSSNVKLTTFAAYFPLE